MNPSPEPPKEAVLLVNTLSRHGFLGISPARSALTRCGLHIKRASAVRSPRRIPRLVREAVKQGEKLVVVGGGDGTIAAAVDPLAYKDVVLGILPLGTGNDFARALGIPSDLDEACRIIAQGRVAAVNLGRLNGDYFANAASIGFSARISRRATGPMKRFLGFGAYILGAFLEFWRNRPFDASLTVDGKEYRLRTSLVIVWNGRFHAGWHLTAAEDQQGESKLIVYAPAAPSRLGLLQMALSLRTGRLPKSTPLLALAAETVEIQTDPPQEVDVDGELHHHTPVTIRLASHALKVIVPQSFLE